MFVEDRQDVQHGYGDDQTRRNDFVQAFLDPLANWDFAVVHLKYDVPQWMP